MNPRYCKSFETWRTADLDEEIHLKIICEVEDSSKNKQTRCRKCGFKFLPDSARAGVREVECPKEKFLQWYDLHMEKSNRFPASLVQVRRIFCWYGHWRVASPTIAVSDAAHLKIIRGQMDQM